MEHNDINWPFLNAVNAIVEGDVAYFVDGNMWCAVNLDFINLQESPAGFGTDRELAKLELHAALDEVRASSSTQGRK